MDSRTSRLTGNQLAKLCRVSIRTVECWRRRNMGPPYTKLYNGAVRYPVEEASAFILKYTGQPPRLEEAWEK